MKRSLCILAMLALSGQGACDASWSSNRAQAPGQPPIQQPPRWQPPYPSPYPQPVPGPAPTVAPVPTPQPPPRTGVNSLATLDINSLRAHAGSTMAELLVALPPQYSARVQQVPLVADTTVGVVNAFAGCDDSGQPFMAVSDGLLEVAAILSQLRAADEVFGGNRVGVWEGALAQSQRPDQPVVRPAPGLIGPAEDVDARKLARQAQLHDEILAYVLGHELAHHYRGHTGCARGQGGVASIATEDLPRILARTLPVLNQPAEIEADAHGVQNVLASGARQPSYRWTEGGSMVILQFFGALEQMSPTAVLFVFQQSHPFAVVRMPLAQTVANTWKLTGGRSWF